MDYRSAEGKKYVRSISSAPVVVVLRDGTRYYGTIDRIKGGQLILRTGMKSAKPYRGKGKKAGVSAFNLPLLGGAGKGGILGGVGGWLRIGLSLIKFIGPMFKFFI